MDTTTADRSERTWAPPGPTSDPAASSETGGNRPPSVSLLAERDRLFDLLVARGLVLPSDRASHLRPRLERINGRGE